MSTAIDSKTAHRSRRPQPVSRPVSPPVKPKPTEPADTERQPEPEGQPAHSPPLKLKVQSATRGRRFPAEPLTGDEVRALLRFCSSRAPTGIRNKALIVVFWRCGLRINEALSLLPKDLDVEQGTLRVLHGKGDRSRLVGIDPEAVAVVQRWIDKRTALGFNGRQPLFCTLDGKPVAAVYVRNLLKRLGRKAGIDKRVHPHGLRHTHAFELANEGHPIHVIQQQLGHSSVATTDRYIRHLNPQQVVEVMRGRTWAK